MEDLIMKIIDIEDRAQEVIKDAKKADRELEERIKDESRKMRDDITRRMEAKNVTLKQIEEEDAEESRGHKSKYGKTSFRTRKEVQRQ